MRRSLTAFLLSLICATCLAQIANPPFNTFQISAAGGFPSRETQVSGPLHQYNLTAGTQFDKSSLNGYDSHGGFYPMVGVTFGAYHYDRAHFPKGTPYSNHYSVLFHYEQTFWAKERFSTLYFLEEGFGYTQDCYDIFKNPESTYGGHFHVAFHMGAFLSYMLTDNLRLFAGPSYAHHSNSKVNWVNTGCDAISVEAGISYSHGYRTTKDPSCQSVSSLGLKSRYFDVHYGACVTGCWGDNSGQSATYISNKLSVNHLWRLTPRFALGTGCDVFFDKGGNEDRTAFSLCASADYYITRTLTISGHVGPYLNGKAANGSPIYETIGLLWDPGYTKWYSPYFGVLTKANFGTAEHLEIVAGFRFP